jgi:aspartyl-tRNA synthetase
MELATRLGLRNPEEFAPLWVVDFPLLELDEESEDGTQCTIHLLLQNQKIWNY